MVNKIIRPSELRIDLASLVNYIDANQTVSLNNIELYYDISEVIWTLPPQAALGSSNVVAIWIGGVRYEGVTAWTRAWNLALQANQSRGIRASTGRPLTVTAVNLAKPDGRRLTTTATLVNSTSTTARTTPQVQQVFTAPQLTTPGPKGDAGLPGRLGPQGPQGLKGDRGPAGPGIQNISVTPQGNLVVTLENNSTINAGSVVGPTPTLTIGSVTAGASPSVTITGGPTSYALNFVLEAGPSGPGSGDVNSLSLYDDPVWINSLAGSKIVGNIAGQAGSVANGVYSNVSYSNPSWIASLDGSKVTNAVLTTGLYSDPGWITALSGTKVTNVVLTTGSYVNPTWLTISSGKVGLGNVTNESKATMFTNAALTGTPTAPTADSGTNTTQIANTQFVASAITAATGSLGTMSSQNATSVAITGGTITGTTVNSVTVGTNGRGARTVSTAGPSGGADGDIWYRV